MVGLIQGIALPGGESVLTEIYQVVPEAEFELRSDLTSPSAQLSPARMQGRPREGSQKHILRLHEVFCRGESPSIHEALCFCEGRLVE